MSHMEKKEGFESPPPLSTTGIISLFSVILVLIIVALVYFFLPYFDMGALQENKSALLSSITQSPVSLFNKLSISPSATYKSSELPGKMLGNGMYVFFIVLITGCFAFASWYSLNYGSYTSTADSVNKLLTIRRHALGIITSAPSNTNSVCKQITDKTVPYSMITPGNTTLINWRPLTVRLAGYLGGVNGPRDGVFDMDFGISNAIFLGARSFIFDIDYDDNYPCAPILLYQDASGIKRSLNTGSIKDGMVALSKYAFNGGIPNYDPVIIVLYLRRVPKGNKQKATFYRAIAKALDPLSSDHLGLTEQGKFHNCASESTLFTSSILNFQRKFIILSNHSSIDLPTVENNNQKENLDFWTNARLHIDDSGKSSTLSKVAPSRDSASVSYATIGNASNLLLLTGDQRKTYSSTTNVYKIAITPLEDVNSVLTVGNLSILLNVLGVNSVPLDVLRQGGDKSRLDSTTVPNPTTLRDLAIGTSSASSTDPLSFWSHAGWSRKHIENDNIQGFANYVQAEPIPGFTIPSPVVPKKPPPSTNSNGGLVSIA
jgi:hypothetical protein